MCVATLVGAPVVHLPAVFGGQDAGAASVTARTLQFLNKEQLVDRLYGWQGGPA